MAWADNTAPTKPQADATTFDTSRTDHNGLLIFIFKNIENLNSVLPGIRHTSSFQTS